MILCRLRRFVNYVSPSRKENTMGETVAFPVPAREALQAFGEIFQDGFPYQGEPGAAWAPGRVNLIGEHTDYNAGYVLPLAVDRVVAFAGRTRGDEKVRLSSMH